MASPMIDLPVCFPILVNEKGEGPVEDHEAAAVVCWSCSKPWSEEMHGVCPRKGEVE